MTHAPEEVGPPRWVPVVVALVACALACVALDSAIKAHECHESGGVLVNGIGQFRCVVEVDTTPSPQACWESWPDGRLVKVQCPPGMDQKINQMVRVHD